MTNFPVFGEYMFSKVVIGGAPFSKIVWWYVSIDSSKISKSTMYLDVCA